jgi:hypothetical protein
MNIGKRIGKEEERKERGGEREEEIDCGEEEDRR